MYFFIIIIIIIIIIITDSLVQYLTVPRSSFVWFLLANWLKDHPDSSLVCVY